MIAQRLTMRAQLMRDEATGTDAWNNPVPPVMVPIGAPLACFVWSKASRELVDGTKTAMVEDLSAMFAIDADVRAGDELGDVTDRKGRTVVAGRLRIDGPVQHKHTHLEAALERIG